MTISLRCLMAIILSCASLPLHAQRQMERLDRGTVAVAQDDGRVFISWRLLGDDPESVAFNVYRAAGDAAAVKLNDKPVAAVTFFVDDTADRSQANSYSVRAVVRGQEQRAEKACVVPAGPLALPYITVPLQTVEGYTPNDASVGDLDGDGQYELVLMQTGRAHDNSHGGVTDAPMLEAYRLDGSMLWRINLGINIRAGAHYTQFLVYDFDGDGRAEVVCKTADGTTDGAGKVIGDAAVDYRNPEGRILAGPEFLTVFDGLTGKALATTKYDPPRHPDTENPTGDQLKAEWGDGYGNRVDRFLAAVAYLDGKRPSIVMCRGYYTRTVLAAWDWRGGKLTHRWTFDSHNGPQSNRTYAGQGNHNLSVADVDGDGKDEIVYGSMVVDDTGKGLYSTGWAHGDAIHVGDLDPSHPGLEVFMPHEAPGHNGGIGTSLRDAATGKPLWTTAAEKDVGRGMTADIDPRHSGHEMWASNNSTLYNAKGKEIGQRPGSMNFGIWWTGDLLRQLLDHSGERGEWHGVVYRWNWQDQKQEIVWEDLDTRSNNWTKGNPVLSADILGDWREEMIWRTTNPRELRIYTTTHPTEHRFVTLMHDPHYRLSVAWQNVGYNQPPHTGFFLGHGMKQPPRPRIAIVESGSR